MQWEDFVLREACAIGALVAAALVPSVAAQAAQGDDDTRPAAHSVSVVECASGNAPKCKYLEENGKKCLYCKGKKGGYKKQSCEKKTTEKKPEEKRPTQIDCSKVKDPLPNRPNRVCTTCTDLETGKVVNKFCEGD